MLLKPKLLSTFDSHYLATRTRKDVCDLSKAMRVIQDDEVKRLHRPREPIAIAIRRWPATGPSWEAPSPRVPTLSVEGFEVIFGQTRGVLPDAAGAVENSCTVAAENNRFTLPPIPASIWRSDSRVAKPDQLTQPFSRFAAETSTSKGFRNSNSSVLPLKTRFDVSSPTSSRRCSGSARSNICGAWAISSMSWLPSSM